MTIKSALRKIIPGLCLLLLAGCSRKDPGTADFEKPASGSRPNSAPGKGIEFADLSFDAALEKAKREQKILMVDFYTDWCGWCKKMDKEVFTDAKVVQAASGMITIKVDAENEGADAARKFEVEGFPTVLFLDGSGKVLLKVVGYTHAEKMLDVLQSLASKKA